MKEPRITYQTLKVLDALAEAGEKGLSGADLCRATKLATGTLYPILSRTERAKWIIGEWEVDDPRELGRPRCRYYTITALGLQRAQYAARDMAPAIGRLGWVSAPSS